VVDSHSEHEGSLGRQELILAATRAVIADIAPQELPLVTPISTAFFADPDGTLRRRASKDEPLGFGVPGEAAPLLTPIAFAVVTEVIKFLAEQVRTSVEAEAPGLIDDLVKSLFKKLRRTEVTAGESVRADTTARQPTLTRQQLAQVREIALQKARALGLTSRKAELLADSLVGGLAVAS
jgi:hypothetical protein